MEILNYLRRLLQRPPYFCDAEWPNRESQPHTKAQCDHVWVLTSSGRYGSAGVDIQHYDNYVCNRCSARRHTDHITGRTTISQV